MNDYYFLEEGIPFQFDFGKRIGPKNWLRFTHCFVIHIIDVFSRFRTLMNR